VAAVQRSIRTVLYRVACQQTQNEPVLLNFVGEYSINSRVDLCFTHIYVILLRTVDSVFVYNTMVYSSGVVL
jgi:hypothetical protein